MNYSAGHITYGKEMGFEYYISFAISKGGRYVNKILGASELLRSIDYYDMKFNGEYLYRNVPECKPGMHCSLVWMPIKNYDAMKVFGNKFGLKLQTDLTR